MPRTIHRQSAQLINRTTECIYKQGPDWGGAALNYEWDETKRLSNIAKHGIDFIDVWELFGDLHIVGRAKPGSDGEQRLIATGLIQGRHVTAIYTPRDDAVRLISLRKASKHERRKYQALFGEGLAPEG